jgi:hypothetical protein
MSTTTTFLFAQIVKSVSITTVKINPNKKGYYKEREFSKMKKSKKYYNNYQLIKILTV